MLRISCLFVLMFFCVNLFAQTNILPYNSTWKYLDNGSNQGTNWRTNSFNDASWASGAAQLGYGDPDITTTVSFGSNANKKHITTYFRKAINLADASLYSGYTINLKRDDGAVVYINGTEQFRSNMPTGTISYTTKAATDATDNGNTVQTITIPVNAFISGNNTIAVEIHQRAGNSNDISFDLSIIATNAPPVCNSPTGLAAFNITYSAATVNWSAVIGAVSYTVDYKTNASATWINAASATTNTSVNLSGLSATTLYDWRVRTNCAASNSVYTTAQFTTQAPPPCDAPAGLASSSITGNSASISWTAVSAAVSYAVDYKANSSSTWLNAASATTNTNIILAGLNPSTLYDWRVRANCAANSSVYTSSQFTTHDPPPCDAPTGLTSSSIAENSATINWTSVSAAVSYAVDYKANSSSTWLNAASATTNTNIILAGLNPSTLYDWRVRTNCAANSSVYTSSQFTTQDPPPCDAPTNLSSSGITASAATVSWTAVSGAVSYAVDYKTNTSSTWINAASATTNTSVNLSGLNATTLYDWRVRTNCISNNSAYATAQFTTQDPPPCNAPGSLSSSNITSTSAIVNWATVSGAVSYAVDYKTNASATWINATASTTSTSLNLGGLTANTLYDWRVRTNCAANSSAYTTAQFTTLNSTPPPSTLIPYGGTWKYLANGTNQGTAWRASAFNDGAWPSGPGQLGYGDGDEATVVPYGPDANNKYITTYFRKTISIADPNAYTSFTVNVKRDDGIAIYINGTERYRNNLAAGAGYTTLATLASDDGATAQTFTLLPSVFVAGNNVIAVEIHQNAANSTDISFDMELKGGTGTVVPALVIGPYLQMGNETAISIRWRTNIASNSRVQIGTTPGGNDIATVSDATSLTEHELRVTGLTADTKYYYTVGTSTDVIQGDANNYFQTIPPANTTRKVRLAVFGDCGTNSLNHQSGSLTAYRNYLSSNGLEAADAWLLLGDNAYSNGTDAEYSSNFFNPYGSTILKNHKLYPAPGNHDYAQSATRQADHAVPYYNLFTLPANAQCGGVASGTEHYFSYDVGNVHILSLNSYGKENGGSTRMYDTSGAQAVWVKQDLAANTKPWVIAYWHHPPYTMGSHNSDTETELINIRQNFIRILERMGVDMILVGHSHDYERSYLLNGYYGNESSFNVGTHAKSSSSAKYDGSANSCPYLPANGANHGTVYVLSGSAGASGGTQSGYPHNAMPWSINDGGMTYIEVEGNRLDQKFIRMDGTIWDKFTMMKDVNKTNNLSIAAGTPTTLTASWPSGTYNWSTGETTRSITVSPIVNTTYTVNDGSSATCINDVFNISMDAGRMAKTAAASPAINTTGLQVYPTIVKRGQAVRLQSGSNASVEAVVLNASGKTVQTIRFTTNGSVDTGKLNAGTYFVRLNSNKKTSTQKIIVTE